MFLRLFVLFLGCIVICNSQLLGGHQKLSLEDPQHDDYQKTRKLGELAVQKLNSMRPQRKQVKLIRVIEAHRQIVAGVKHTLKIRVRDATCQRGCNTEVCNVEIIELVARNNQPEIINKGCSPQKSYQSRVFSGNQ